MLNKELNDALDEFYLLGFDPSPIGPRKYEELSTRKALADTDITLIKLAIDDANARLAKANICLELLAQVSPEESKEEVEKIRLLAQHVRWSPIEGNSDEWYTEYVSLIGTELTEDE